MKILCLQQSSVFETYGGIEYYLHDLLTLTQKLLGPDSVTTLIPKRSDSFNLFDTNYQVITVPFTFPGTFQKIENRLSPKMISQALLLAQKEKPQLIWVGHVSLAPMGYALSKIMRIPFWTMAYGLEVWGGLGLPTEWALRKSEAVLSISHWTKDILIARGFQNSQIHVVHPCLQPGFEAKPTKSYDLSSNTPLKLLTVSRLDASEQYKGQDHVIQALGMIKRTHPHLVPHYTIQGDGNDRERLEQLVFFTGLHDHVTFLGRTDSREQLEQLYRDSDVFVMPSRFGCWEGKWRGEGFGIVYVEAAALGVPSIAYQCGGVTDIIQNEESGFLVEPDNIQRLADLLLDLTHNRTRIQDVGRRAQKHVQQQFSAQSMKRQIANALNSCQGITEIRPSTDSIDVPDVLNTLS